MSLDLIDTSALDVLELLKSTYYEQTGKTIQIGSDEFAQASVQAYVWPILFNTINNATKNRYIDFAKGEFLDALAANYGIEKRPDGYKATASFQLVYNVSNTVIPANSIIVQSEDGKQFTNPYDFLNTETTQILQALEAGTDYNGYPAGAVNNVVEGSLYISSAVNTSITAGGTDGFGDDDVYRIWLKNEILSFSGCGTYKAYEAKARNTDARVLDAYVLKQGDSGYQKGKVQIYILTAPDTDINRQVLFLVQKACEDPAFRPIGDLVVVNYALKTLVDITATIQVTYPSKFNGVATQRNRDILAEYNNILSQHINRPFKFDEFCSMLTKKDSNSVYALDAKPINILSNTYPEPIYPVIGCVLNVNTLNISTVFSNKEG